MGQRRSEEARRYWRGLIAEQAASGQSAAEFCRRRGTWASSFFRWKRILAELGEDAAPPFVELRRVEAPGESATPEIELRWANGPSVWVRAGFDPELLRAVVVALAVER